MTEAIRDRNFVPVALGVSSTDSTVTLPFKVSSSTGGIIIDGALSIGSAVGSGTVGSVLFVGASGNLGQDNANFFWDDTNNRLGIGTAIPTRILSLKAGSSTTLAQGGGVIADFFTDTTVGGAETDIYSTTTTASILATNGDKIIATYSGNFITVGTEATQLKVYFAGTAIWDSTAVAVATGTTSWRVRMELIRVSATVVRYVVSLNTTGASGYVYATSGELTALTLTNTNILKITGTSSGVGSGVGDIVGRLGYIEWKSAA